MFTKRKLIIVLSLIILILLTLTPLVLKNLALWKITNKLENSGFNSTFNGCETLPLISTNPNLKCAQISITNPKLTLNAKNIKIPISLPKLFNINSSLKNSHTHTISIDELKLTLNDLNTPVPQKTSEKTTKISRLDKLQPLLKFLPPKTELSILNFNVSAKLPNLPVLSLQTQNLHAQITQYIPKLIKLSLTLPNTKITIQHTNKQLKPIELLANINIHNPLLSKNDLQLELNLNTPLQFNPLQTLNDYNYIPSQYADLIKELDLSLTLTKLTLATHHQDLTLNIHELTIPLKNLNYIKPIHIEKITLQTLLKKPNKINAIAINTPHIKIGLDELRNSIDAKNDGLLSFLRPSPPTTETKPQKNTKQPPKSAKLIAQKSAKLIQSLKEITSQSFNKLKKLPPIYINNAQIAFIDEENKAFTLNGLNFDTSKIKDLDQSFDLDFKVRNAYARFTLAFPDTPDALPEIQLDLKNLHAKDLFSLFNIPKPRILDGYFNTSMHFSSTEDSLNFDATTSFVDFAIHHPKISVKNITNINAAIDFQASYNFNEDKLTIEPMTLSLNPINVNAVITVDKLIADPVIKFRFWAQDLICADIPKAFPPGLLQTITQLNFVGTKMSPELSGIYPIRKPFEFNLTDKGFENTDCYPITVAPHNTAQLNDPNYTFTFTQYTTLQNGITVGPGTNSYLPLENMPPYLIASMYLTEDMRFFDHGPLRTSFITRAMRLNIHHKKYVYGGSTISQQLVKNLFLDRSKNLARKLEEALIAWNMEHFVSKHRILELYINMIEFGPDVYGVKNAAFFYFNKKPSELTPLESAYLASLKISPSKGGSFYKKGFPQNRWWNRRIRKIMKRLTETGYISPPEVLAAYPWIPKFYYPDPQDKSDPRNIWLATH